MYVFKHRQISVNGVDSASNLTIIVFDFCQLQDKADGTSGFFIGSIMGKHMCPIIPESTFDSSPSDIWLLVVKYAIGKI